IAGKLRRLGDVLRHGRGRLPHLVADGVVMKRNVAGLLFGVAFGIVLAWAHLSHADVIRDMLMLREPHVLLLMGASVAVSGIGSRVLRAMKVKAPLAGEPIDWELVRPEKRHIIGSILFGIGWATAG